MRTTANSAWALPAIRSRKWGVGGCHVLSLTVATPCCASMVYIKTNALNDFASIPNPMAANDHPHIPNVEDRYDNNGATAID